MSLLAKATFGVLLLNLCALALCPAVLAQDSKPVALPSAQTNAVAPSEYQQWIARYTKGPLSGWFDSKATTIKCVLTAIEGDEPEPKDGNAPLGLMSDRTVGYGCQVSTTGIVHHFYYSSWGIKGGGYPQIPQAELKRLHELLALLPDDGAHLLCF